VETVVCAIAKTAEVISWLTTSPRLNCKDRPLPAMPIAEAMATDDLTGLTDYSPDGADLTLIRWMLSLTPAERLEFLEQRVHDIIAIRELNAGT
jgi:hypothetical protein